MSLLGKFVAGAAGAGVEILMQKQKAEILAQRDAVLHKYRMAESSADIAGRQKLVELQGTQELEAIGQRGTTEEGLIEKRKQADLAVNKEKAGYDQSLRDSQARSNNADAAYKEAITNGSVSTTKPKYVQENSYDEQGMPIKGDWVNQYDPADRKPAGGANPNAGASAGSGAGAAGGNPSATPMRVDFDPASKTIKAEYGIDISTDKVAIDLAKKGDTAGLWARVQSLQAENGKAADGGKATPDAMPETSATKPSAESAQAPKKDAAGIMGSRMPSGADAAQAKVDAAAEAEYDPELDAKQFADENAAKNQAFSSAIESSVDAVKSGAKSISEGVSKTGAANALQSAMRENKTTGKVSEVTLDRLERTMSALDEPDQQKALKILARHRPK